MVNKSTDIIASFAKGLRVIEAFDAQSPRLSITDVASRTGLDRATARRCLLTLHAGGYADYDGKFFTLTPRVLRLGQAALASMSLPQRVQPWLDQLGETLSQSCSVAILDGDEIVYVARAAQKRVMSIGLMPGSRLPAHCTSLGRVLLAALPAAEVRARLETVDLSPRTARSLTSLPVLLEEIARVRQQGYSLVDQEVEPGLRSLAVPLFNPQGKCVAALNVGLAALEVPAAETLKTYLPYLQEVQRGLQRILT